MYLFSWIGSGPSGSGKSSFCISFLQKIDVLCNQRKFGGAMVSCYGEKTGVPSRQQLPANISFNEGVPDNFGNVHNESPRDSRILNDDYSKLVCVLFTKGRFTEISRRF